VIACGAIAKEIVALRQINNWQHMDIQCLPASLHNRPELIPQQLREKILQEQDNYKKIFVAYGDCGTGGLLDKVLTEFDLQRLTGAHCYEFFSGDKFMQLHESEPGTFYLTDFLLRHFQRLVIEGLGIDQYPQLISEYFKHYKKVVYLSQSHSEKLQEKARACAEQLQLDYEYYYTGLDALASEIKPALEEAVQWQN